jgi:energy-coupling factor transporter ATP-binding protein EcfA2
MAALKRLIIQNFRGSIGSFALTFDEDARLTIIYGENGTGKSTICDALEFLSRGKVSSLEKRGLGQTIRYWPSLGKDFADVSVTLETLTGACRATLRNGEAVAVPGQMPLRAEVFSRSQILSLIEAKPGDRYAAVSRFIDVSGVERSEATLRDLIRNLTRSRDLAVARLEENAETIRRFWETAEAPGVNPVEWAEAECASNTDLLEAEIAALNGLQAAYSRLADIPERLRSAQQGLKAARDIETKAGRLLEERLQVASKDAGELIAILQAAEAYLVKNSTPHVCPLCESPVKAADLNSRIRERLNALASLQDAQSGLAAARQASERAEQQFQAAREAARQDVERFDQYRSEFEWPDDIRLPASRPANSLSAITAWLAENANLPGEWRTAEVARLDRKQFLSTLRQALTVWRDNLAVQQALERLLPRLERALHIVVEERRRFTDDVLASIAGEVERLYETVHPGEGLNRIRLELDPKKRASLEIGAAFCGRMTRPQAYFSDSHLDTLGLCIFFALAALDQPENTILVLDDVLSSADEAHANRLLELLHSEAAQFRHIIITTHNRSWKDRFGATSGKNHLFQFVELGQWSPTSGLSLRGSGAG